MLVLNNTPFVHARVYLQYLKSALPGPPGYIKSTRCIPRSSSAMNTTLFMVLSVTRYSELRRAMDFIFIPTKVKLVVWTL